MNDVAYSIHYFTSNWNVSWCTKVFEVKNHVDIQPRCIAMTLVHIQQPCTAMNLVSELLKHLPENVQMCKA